MTNSFRPDTTAVRVALWRALHTELDAPPHILEDRLGLELAAPDKNWRDRPDMNASRTKTFRASIVARARFIEDLVLAQTQKGIDQYVLLGSGLDTFALRRPDLAFRINVYEVDKPDHLAWKEHRFRNLKFDHPQGLHFVPVDFEKGALWWDALLTAGFQNQRPTVVACTGVIMYLTKEAIVATFQQLSKLAPGSMIAISYLLPVELADPEEQAGFRAAIMGAKANGTPFLSFFSPAEMTAFVTNLGFRNINNISGDDLFNSYFSNRTDGLRPSNSEQIIIFSPG